MVARSFSNGNRVICKSNDVWRYEDGTPLKIHNDFSERACPKCGSTTKHDGCLGILPSVKNACCGHGVERGYIQFSNGVIIRFDNLTVEHII